MEEMVHDNRLTGERQPAPRSRSWLFSVRLWKEEVGSGPEYRGQVRDLMGATSRNFRDWSELIEFMCDRIEEQETEEAG